MQKISKGAVLAALMTTLTACGGGGGEGSSPAPTDQPSTPNNQPIPVIKATGTSVSTSTAIDLKASLNTEVLLDASTSLDADKDVLTFDWRISKKPQNSNLALNPTQTVANTLLLRPDITGLYEIVLNVTDIRGASATKKITIDVSSASPNTSKLERVVFSAVGITPEPQNLTIGSTVLFDRDATNANSSLNLEIISKPTTSRTKLVTQSATATGFTADVAGTYVIKATGKDAQGQTSSITYQYVAANQSPTVLVVPSIDFLNKDIRPLEALVASVGYTVLLNAENSTDADQDALTFNWELTRQPTDSKLGTVNTNSPKLFFSPDVLGYYELVLKVTDARGIVSSYTQPIYVNNIAPTARIETTATPVVNAPITNVTMPINTSMVLRGAKSTDPEGDALTYQWSVLTAPEYSLATIQQSTKSTAEFTPDRAGSYTLRLRVTDAKGAHSDQVLIINSGNNSPVAVVNADLLQVFRDEAAMLSGRYSFDPDGDKLTYSWTLDTKPAGSTAVITAANQPDFNFKPDVDGSYIVTLQVSDGKNTHSASSLIRKSSAAPAIIVPLPAMTDAYSARYSAATDSIVFVNSIKKELYSANPISGSQKKIALPFAIPHVTLSNIPNVTLSHSGRYMVTSTTQQDFSLVDLVTKQVRSFKRKTTGSQYYTLVTDRGLVYIINLETSPPEKLTIELVDPDNDQNHQITDLSNDFFDTSRKILDFRLFFLERSKSIGISYTDDNDLFGGYYIDLLKTDEKTGKIFGITDKSNSNTGFISRGYNTRILKFDRAQDYIVYNWGDVFKISDQKPIGKPSLQQWVFDVSFFPEKNELVSLDAPLPNNSDAFLPASYSVHTGDQYQNKTTINLPVVNGVQLFGVQAFHSNNGQRIFIASTRNESYQNAAYQDAGEFYLVLQ